MNQSTIMGFKQCKPTLTYYIIQKYLGRRPTNIITAREQSTDLFINCILTYKLRDRFQFSNVGQFGNIIFTEKLWDYYFKKQEIFIILSQTVLKNHNQRTYRI